MKKLLVGSDQTALYDQRWVSEQTSELPATLARLCSEADLDMFTLGAHDLSTQRLVEELSDSNSNLSPKLTSYRQLCELIEHRYAGVIVIERAHHLNGKSAHTLARIARYSRRNQLNWKFILIGKANKMVDVVLAQLPLDEAYPKERFGLGESEGEQESTRAPGFSFGDMAKYLAIALVLIVFLGGLMIALSEDEAVDVIVHVDQTAPLEQTIEQTRPNEYSGYSLDEIYDSKARDLEFQNELDAISRKSGVIAPESQASETERSQSQSVTVTPSARSAAAIELDATMPANLENAIAANSLTDVQAILSDEEFLTSQNKNGESVLIVAINQNSDATVEWLLTQNVDVSKVDRHGRSALFYSTITNKTQLVTRLLELGASPNQSSRLRKTPLMIAVHNDYKEVAELLIEAGANVNEIDHSGWSALFYAVWNNNREITQLLLSIGANPNQKDSNGNTPIDVARSRPGNQLGGLLSSASNQ